MLDFAALRLPASPNAFLLAPQGFCPNAVPHASAPDWPCAPEVAARALLEVARGAPRTEVTAVAPDGLAFEAVQRSALFKFCDDVSVRVFAAPQGGSDVAIFSRARVGYSDLGVNRKRVLAWLAAARTRTEADAASAAR